ncbi:hypothetical protein B0T24DRAFT_93371 [Lasiosphaeria ovina]|uniref:DUF7726 domain-containing protein n=1 Tax=Lasiosphaeria ovina TaxID=92902 RepID=A0AAE0NNG8_9PEZI|nr:hypothetical protein B0T24DRAFT_93371 [Lasiosphaeria ovina]
MPSTRRDGLSRDQLLADLKAHTAITDERLDELKHLLITAYYLSQHGQDARIVALGQKYYRPGGSSYALKDVPAQDVVSGVGAYIHATHRGWSQRPADICDKVFANVPSKLKDFKSWEAVKMEIPNPKATPATIFSESRAQPPESRKSNAELFADLAFSAGFDMDELIYLKGIIAWWDSMAGGKSGMWCPGEGEVKGGRLGRDHLHTIEDVPNCYVRDCIMDYINTELERGSNVKKADVQRAVFSDLTNAEIKQYSKLVSQRMDAIRSGDLLSDDEEPQPAEPEPKNPLHEALHQYYDLRIRLGELKRKEQQDDALAAVDDTVNLKPYAKGTNFRRDRDRDEIDVLSRSVVRPGAKTPLPAESAALEGVLQCKPAIRHDVDQVRAMIKRFVLGGEWTLDQFRIALGPAGPTRQHLRNFLGHKGATQHSKTFNLSWEFFHRRELLGLPLVGASPDRDAITLISSRARGAKRCSGTLHGVGRAAPVRKAKRPRV